MAYFADITGRGQYFICKLCSVKTWFVNYQNGTDEKGRRFPYMGFQCQDCGTIQLGNKGELEHTDDKCIGCCGTLKRDKPLFCPSCKWNKIQDN